MKKLLMALVLIAGVGASTAAEAAPTAAATQDRIEQGIRTGALTKAEAKIAQANAAQVKAYRAKVWRDGVMTRAEQAQLSRLEEDSRSELTRLLNNRTARRLSRW